MVWKSDKMADIFGMTKVWPCLDWKQTKQLQITTATTTKTTKTRITSCFNVAKCNYQANAGQRCPRNHLPWGDIRDFSNRMCCAFQPCEDVQFASCTEPLLVIVSIERLIVKSIRKLRRNLTNQSKHVGRGQGGNQSRILRFSRPYLPFHIFLHALPRFAFVRFLLLGNVCIFSYAWLFQVLPRASLRLHILLGVLITFRDHSRLLRFRGRVISLQKWRGVRGICKNSVFMGQDVKLTFITREVHHLHFLHYRNHERLTERLKSVNLMLSTVPFSWCEIFSIYFGVELPVYALSPLTKYVDITIFPPNVCSRAQLVKS